MTTFSADLLAVFFIGLLGSAHCLVMCGGIATALQIAMPQNSRRKFVYQLLLSFGRLTTYSIFGALVGYLGIKALQFAGLSMHWFRFVAGILMLMMALYISKIWFGLIAIERFGQKLWRHIQPIAASLVPLNSFRKAFSYGLCWGALPCGLVYSTLSWSLSSGNALNGALLMFVFGLGTTPAILLSGTAANWLHQLKNNDLLRYTGAAILAIYACYTIWLALMRLVF